MVVGAPPASATPAAPTGPVLRELELSIRGMTCGACAAKVERALNSVPHVSASVNYASERAAVALHAEVPVATLIERVERAGYGARPATSERAAEEEQAEDDRRVRSLGRRLAVALVLLMPLCEGSIEFSLVPWLRFPGWQLLLIALALPVVAWAAWPFHRGALRALRHGTCTMDTLVSVGVVAATGWSVYAMFFQDPPEPGRSALYILLNQSGGGIYLDVAGGVTAFLLAGRLFEAWARRRTGNALRALAARGAKDVAIVRADGIEERVPIARLRIGDRFAVRPGETIATDGRVVSGRSEIDTSAMTGESVPSDAEVGDRVLGATTALSGRLVVRATAIGTETQLGQMVRLVEQAQLRKSSVQRLADRVASVFVPTVLLLTAATITGWLLAGASPARAFAIGLAVLIIACPCALGLATPMALRVASGRGAQLGIFFKNHQALEASRLVDTVVLDKTGTLTTGRMTVAGVEPAPGVPRSELLRLVGAVEGGSSHPIAAALVELARAEVGALPEADDCATLAGLGATGQVAGERVLAGRASLFAEHGVAISEPLLAAAREREAHGETVVFAGCGEGALGLVALTDAIKPSARAAVDELRRLGLRCILVTGDHEVTARAVAAQVGIDEVTAAALPQDKVAVIRRLQQEGRRVAVVGDGVNDAPALAAADLGLAVGSGTDVAISAADLILVRDDLRVVPAAISLARRTLMTIRRNLVWAFGYNVAAIPLAASGHLDPLVAGGAMALSSAFVVWSSGRLRRSPAVSGR
ncbi:MAG: heavy metal translocating P-type ATPase [Candidatus Dormiibacterota bacterium]